jgi:hypothetical protein
MPEPNRAEKKKKLVLRRDFLTGSSAAIAAGALSVCVPESAAAVPQVSAPSYAASSGYLVYDIRSSGMRLHSPGILTTLPCPCAVNASLLFAFKTARPAHVTWSLITET